MLERQLSPMPMFTAVLVLMFGGLTLYLKNDIFIKMKPTVLYAFFGVMLLGGLAFNRLFIKYVFAQAFELTEDGWRKLTWRWGIFFFALARAQRDRLAEFFDRGLGRTSRSGHRAADLSVRAGADAASCSSTRSKKETQATTATLAGLRVCIAADCRTARRTVRSCVSR